MSSVFSTPLLTPLLRVLAGAALKIAGWKISLRDVPAPPFILIGAPHTSNWDFPLMLCTVLHLGHEARWLGKTSLFTPPFGPLMRWLGGIPVNRDQSQNAVAVTAQALRQNPGLILCVAPEGTRRKVQRWRTGFYYIALAAEVPIVMLAIDADACEVCHLGQYRPTGDVEAEIPEIQRRYRGFGGIIPENAFELQDQ